MIFLEEPADFLPKFSVVSCFCEYNKRFLLLQRHPHKSQGNTWGVPAGKIESNETAVPAMIRELKEETGIIISDQQLTYITTVYVRYPDYDFVYLIFSTQLIKKEVIFLNPTEHIDKVWVTPQQALKMNLIGDLDNCIKLYYFTSEPEAGFTRSGSRYIIY